MRKDLFFIFIITFFLSFNANGLKNYDEQSLDFEWEQVVDFGFGDKDNLHAWSIKEYKDFLYVGTRNVVDGCKIYRSETGDLGTWFQVNLDGFSNESKSEGIRNMIVYKDLLWVITNSWEHGTQVWVTEGVINKTTGLLNWRKANLDGFGKGSEILSSRGLGVFKDKLYVGSQSIDGHPLIFRYEGPSDFEDICKDDWILLKDWYEDPDYNPDLFLVGDIVNFTCKDGESYLYASLIAGVTPIFRNLKTNFTINNMIETFRLLFFSKGEIWRYNGTCWEKIDSKIFDKTSLMVCCLHVFNETLYAGTANWLGGEIWKTDDGNSFTRISKRGFYSPFNFWVWKIHDYKGRLIAGTLNPVFGCDVWASVDNSPSSTKDFIRISKKGMDGKNILNPFTRPQDGARCFETFKGKMYLGTTNWVDLNSFFKGTGCEVWRMEKI